MKELIDKLKGQSRIYNRVAKLINKYERLKENSTENAFLMEKNLTDISNAVNNISDIELKNSIINWVSREKESVDKAKSDFRFILGEKLKELFRNENWDLKGQYPILRVKFYTLKLDFEFGETTLYFGPEVEKIKSKIPLEPVSIYETIKRYDRELRATKFDPKEFYSDLRLAYERRIIISKKVFGEKLLLVDVLYEFVILKQSTQFFVDPKKENFREFSRIKLAYLLYLFKKSNLFDKNIHLYIATFDATTDRRNSLWVPENEEGDGTYYEYIAFEKTTGG